MKYQNFLIVSFQITFDKCHCDVYIYIYIYIYILIFFLFKDLDRLLADGIILPF